MADVRVQLPLGALDERLRKGKPKGDGIRPEPGRAQALRVRLPLLPLSTAPGPSPRVGAGIRGSANGRLPDFESGDEGSNPSPRTLERRRASILGDRLTVGHLALNQRMEVRVLLPEYARIRQPA